jgi:hypothetical protein
VFDETPMTAAPELESLDDKAVTAAPPLRDLLRA